MCSCVLLSSGRFGPLRAEVGVGLRRVRLVQALLSSRPSAGLVPLSVGLRFSFLLPFQGFPFRARCVVLVFSLSLFSCVPLFASWLSIFHFIFIVISLSFHLPRCGGACVRVFHLYRCKTSIYRRGQRCPCHFLCQRS